MDQFFTENGNQPQIQEQEPNRQQYQPVFFEAEPVTFTPSNTQPPTFDFSAYSANEQSTAFNAELAPENDFNDFEEDEMTKRIREEEERIQNKLRQKSWEQKSKRQQDGRKQLQQFLSRKQVQKTERAAQNIRKEAESKQEMSKLNVEAGWKKVITNINVRASEHKGKKDINRMREAILHRREDDPR